MREINFFTVKTFWYALSLLFLSSIFLTKKLYAQHLAKSKLENDIIIDWNQLCYQIAYEHDQFYSFIGVRSLSMMHIGIHDALNAIEPKYEQYAFQEKITKASVPVAISQAAYEVLLHAYPERKDTISLVYNKWMNEIKNSRSKRKAILLGKSAAKAIIQLREGDGHKKQGGYTPMTKPGDYQYTPGWDNWVLKPDFDYARPFCMDTVIQFRSPVPPLLTSENYAKSYEEVKKYGVKDSEFRSKDQTNYAHWWAEFAEHSWNRIGRITAKEQKLPILETARMFALINMNIYDIYLASLESKYYYDTWRPYTAIRSGATDGNAKTIADTNWQPEIITPPWPEYPSAHAAVGSGGAEIVAHIYGSSDLSFSMKSISALPHAKIRSYQNLDKAADDCADSRIMNGYHFRFATEEGKRQGREIAKYVHSNYLRSLKK